jgi:hypothetical protein
LSGVIVDAATGTPVVDAVVSLANEGRTPLGSQSRQLTDAKGRFVFVNLPADNYAVSVSKAGYLDGGYSRDNAAAGSVGLVAISDGEWASGTRVSIWRPGSIAGAVMDEHGDPVVGIYVRALVRVRIQGRDELAAGPMTTTDDRGLYRLSGLTPGSYVIEVPSVQASVPASASLPGAGRNPVDALDLDPATRLVIGRFPLPPPSIDGRSLAYPIAFHPGTPVVADAVGVDLDRGEERTGIDIALAPVPTSRVSGIVEGPPEALTKLTLRLLPAGLENLGQGSEVGTALVDADGRFTFLNVPAGAYTLDAPRMMGELTTGPASLAPSSAAGFAPPPGSSGWSSQSQSVSGAPPGTSFTSRDFRSGAANFWGRTPIVVAGPDTSGIVVRLRRGATMSGRIVLAADPNKPAPNPPISMQLDPAGGNPALGIPRSSYDPDGAANLFTIDGLMPGEYYLRTTGQQWTVKSVQWKGRDYTDTPFDASATEDFAGVVMTLTNAVPVLTGAIRRPDGTPAVGATVVAFPVEPGGWTNYGLLPARIKTTLTTSLGSYRVDTLPAGDYYVVALAGSAATVWQDPEFFRTTAAVATRVSLSWGGQTNQDLTISRVQ